MALPRRKPRRMALRCSLEQTIWSLRSHGAADAAVAPGTRTKSRQPQQPAHRTGFIDFDDLQGARVYSPWKAYGQSKLATLMFALELQRRSDAAGWNLISNAAHPGFARTTCSRAVRAAFFLLRPISRLMFGQSRRTAPDRSCSRRRAGGKAGAYYGPEDLASCEGHRRAR